MVKEVDPCHDFRRSGDVGDGGPRLGVRGTWNFND